MRRYIFQQLKFVSKNLTSEFKSAGSKPKSFFLKQPVEKRRAWRRPEMRNLREKEESIN